MPRGKKDPNKPKGCKTAYIFFTEYRREELKRNGDETNDFASFASGCGKLWKTMDDCQKERFEKLAHDDRKRYQKEIEDYSPPENSDDSDDEGPKKKKKKKMKDPNAPKRNMSAYFFFAGSIREDVKGQLTQEKGEPPRVTEVMTVIGERWRQCADHDKIVHDESAKKDRERYQRQLKEYNTEGCFR